MDSSGTQQEWAGAAGKPTESCKCSVQLCCKAFAAHRPTSRPRRLFVASSLVAGQQRVAMPSAACYRNYGKTFKKPRRPFEKERLDAELKVVGEFGLRNKRELWRVQMVLSKLRARARDLLTLDEKDAK